MASSRKWPQQLQNGNLLRRLEDAENRQDEAGVPERGRQPVGVQDGVPGERADDGCGYDGTVS